MRLGKKVLAVLLAVMAIMVLTALPVSAQDDQFVYSELVVDDVSNPVIGGEIDLWAGYVQANADIINQTWLVFEAGGTTPVYVIDRDISAAFFFEEGYTYTWIGEVEVYYGAVDANTVVTVNGKPATVVDLGEGKVEITCEFGAPIVMNDIESIEINGITAPVAGAQSSLTGITAPTEAGYSVTNIYWRDITDDEYHDPYGTPPLTFAKGHDYELGLSLEAADGYAFMHEWEMDENSVCANIGADEVEFFWYSSNEAQVSLYFYADDADVTLVAPAIELKEPAVGDAISFDWIKLPEGAEGYYISNISMDVYNADGERIVTGFYTWSETNPQITWMDPGMGPDPNPVADPGKHAEGNYYDVYINLKPEDGYVFANSQKTEDFTVNGEVVERSNIERNHANAELQLCYTTIDEYVVNGITAPVVGQTATFEGIKVPENAKYWIDYMSWSERYLGTWIADYTWYEGTTEGEPFQFKEHYDYELTINFVYNYNGVIVSDEVTVQLGDLGQSYANASYSQAYIGWEADRNDFTKVSPAVDGLEAPAAGNTPDLDVTVPAGFKLGVIVWYEIGEDGDPVAEYGKYLENGEYLPYGEAFQFKADGKYQLRINVVAENGYICTGTRLPINGKTDYIGDSGSDASGAYASVCYGFEVIEKVEIVGVTKPEIGKPATFEGITSITENVEVVYMSWIEYDQFGEPVKDMTWYSDGSSYGEDIIFQEGHDYTLVVEFRSFNQRVMGNAVTVTINGAEAEYAQIALLNGGSFIQYQADGSEAVILDQVAVEGVSVPVVGQTATFEGIQLPASMKGYKILAMAWIELDENGEFTDNLYDWYAEGMDVEIEGAPFQFEAGKKYVLAVICGREMGYAFSMNLQTLVNGAEAETIEEGFYPSVARFSMEYEATTSAPNPPTGDSFGIFAPVVMLLAVAALACLAWNRKKFLA